MQCVQWFVLFAKFCTSACKYNSLNVNNMQETLTQLDDLHCHSKFEILIHVGRTMAVIRTYLFVFWAVALVISEARRHRHKERNGEDLVV